MPLYLGFDVRSDSLTATMIEIGAASRRIVFQRSITCGSTLMWDDALDRIMSELAEIAAIDFDELRGLSGAAGAAEPALEFPAAALLALHPSRPLAPQLRAIASDDELRTIHQSPRAFFTQLLASTYWQRRYSVPPVRIVPWETVHASTLVGTGIIRGGLILVALGATDTVADIGGARTFRNGSAARERMRLEYQLDADTFAALLEQRPGNDGLVMLPWLETEMTPAIAHAGVRRFGFDSFDAGTNVRGLVEGQMMAMANHAADLSDAPIDRVIATGADAADRALLQVMANVFGVDVYRLDIERPAALGAALRAYQADRLDSIEPVSWKTVVSVFTDPLPGHRVSPNPKHAAMYEKLRREYAILERLHKDRPPIC